MGRRRLKNNKQRSMYRRRIHSKKPMNAERKRILKQMREAQRKAVQAESK